MHLAIEIKLTLQKLISTINCYAIFQAIAFMHSYTEKGFHLCNTMTLCHGGTSELAQSVCMNPLMFFFDLLFAEKQLDELTTNYFCKPCP